MPTLGSSGDQIPGECMKHFTSLATQTHECSHFLVLLNYFQEASLLPRFTGHALWWVGEGIQRPASHVVHP